MVKIYRAAYKDVSAVNMESDALLVQFLPELGGKMASLVHKKTSREFLVQSGGESYKALEYDKSYIDSECSGFDDMFPTIDECYYERFPWQGTRLPDHGEVCSLCWDCRIEGDILYMKTYGVRLPYMLEKRVFFEDSETLRIDYRAANLSEFDMDFIWAAHVMLNAEEGMKLLLPFKEGVKAFCVFSYDPGLGKHGDLLTWPATKGADGGVRVLDEPGPMKPDGNSYKFYFDEKIPEGWLACKYPDDGMSLTLQYPEEKVPYMGIWVNEGSFKGLYNIAPEPCTGAFDRLDAARLHNKNSILKAKEQFSWFLKFKAAAGE